MADATSFPFEAEEPAGATRPLHFRRRRTGVVAAVIAAGAAIALGLGGGTAYAYFTSHGTGSGSGGAGSLQAVTVTALVGGDTESSPLVPNGSADVILRVKNPNSFAVTLVSVAGGPGSITADSGHPGCTTTGVTFTNQTSLHATIAASGTTLVDLAGAASMSTASSTGCQGATFNIPVTIQVDKG